jgi:chromosome segregation ATPase
LMQNNMDSSTEKLVSLIEKLEENQQNINEDVRGLKASQHKIATQVIPAQRKFASQVNETTEITRRDQAELRIAFQGASLELAENQNKIQEDLVTLRQNLNNSTESAASLVQRLDENQQTINSDLDSLKTAQDSIMTQVIPTQRQLADQLAQTTMTIQRDKAELSKTLQGANTQLARQVKTISERQDHLELTTETLQENGQALRVSHDQYLAKLTNLKRAYQAKQEQLDLMKARLATLDSNVVAVLTGLSQIENTLKEDLRGKHIDQNEKIQKAEQSLQHKFTGLTSMLVEVEEVQKTLLTLLQDVDRPAKAASRTAAQTTEFFRQKKSNTVSSSRPKPLNKPQTSVQATPSPQE